MTKRIAAIVPVLLLGSIALTGCNNSTPAAVSTDPSALPSAQNLGPGGVGINGANDIASQEAARNSQLNEIMPSTPPAFP